MSAEELTVREVEQLSYTDFIGLINQWNVPPGAFTTLNKWRLFGEVDSASRILEVACTTGFSSRELALLTGCQALGIDISAASIRAARENQKKYALKSKLTYRHADVATFTNQNFFSHIVLGAALRFFPHPQTTLKHLLNLLEPHGFVLSCEFFCQKKIPAQLVTQARNVFNITVTQSGYKEVMAPYRNLTLLYEDHNDIRPETDDELDHYTRSTIDRAVTDAKIKSADVYEALYQRLLKIKKISNALRPYQQYVVLAHRKDPRIYPHRYTELF